MTDVIDTSLADFARRRRRVRAAGIICLAIAIVFLWVLGVGLIDRLLQLSVVARLLAGAGLATIASLLALRVLSLLLRRRFDPLIAAAQVERLSPGLRDRLLTVVTQRRLPAPQRGSDALCQVIAGDVALRLADRPPATLISSRMIRPAVVLMALSVLLTLVLVFVPWLGLPTLLARQVMPLADIPPVTTTRIDPVTGDVDLPQGQPLAIVADVHRGPGEATLWVGADESALQPVAMARSFGDRFAATLPSVERDLVYRITSGDARSAAHRIRVLRRPALARLDVELDFPAYLHRAPLSTTSDDGRIETISGTRVRVRLQATEPLTRASLSVGDERIETAPTIDPFVREAEFVVSESTPWSVEMVSDRNVTGDGFGDMQIVAVDDRPPVVQLVRRDLRLHPSDVVAIPFQAIDDFGIASMTLQAEAGGRTLVSRAVPLTGDRRMLSDVATIDLAPYALSFGEVVSVTVAAVDVAGQLQASEPCRILLSPRSVDPRVLRRIDALAEALQWVETIQQQPTDAAMAVRSLLRVVALSDEADFGEAITAQADRVQQVVSRLVWVEPGSSDNDRKLANRVVEVLRTLHRGQQARLLLAELENVKAAEENRKELSRQEQEAMRQSLSRARSEIDARLKSLGLDARSADLQHKLEALDLAARQLTSSERAPAAAQVARDWCDSRTAPEVNRDRIAIAAQAQVLRPDSDLIWARDLQLIARAMTRLQERESTRPREMQGVVEALEALHRARPEQREGLLDRAEAARKTLRGWAGEALVDAPETPLDQAMEQSAKLAEKSPRLADPASEAGAENGPETWEPPGESGTASADPASRQAEQIARLARQQQRVSERTRSASSESASSLGEEQTQIAGALEQVEQEAPEDFFETSRKDQREAALEALRAGQRALADLPQKLRELEQQARRVAEMRQSARRSEEAVQRASKSDRVSAERTAQEAARQLADAQRSLEQSASSVSTGTSRLLQSSAQQLGALGGPIAEAVEGPLSSAMQQLEDSMSGADLASTDLEQEKVLDAIAELQATLRVAQRQATDRDPVQAARFYAEKAAEALNQKPPDLDAARDYQKQTGEALTRAWDAAVAQSVKDKLQSLPAFRSLLADDMVMGEGAGEAAPLFDRTLDPQWGRLREQRDLGTTAGGAAFVPPGYEQALRLYFETLDKAKSGRKQ